MPRRSAGCEKCRQRKVRCDEARPKCRRCLDYGVDCPGYRPPAEKDLQFVDQTDKIAHHSGAATGPRNSPRSDQTAGDRVALAPRREPEFRWRHQFSGGIAQVPGPDSVNNRHLHRAQLLSTFLDLYLPKRRDRSMMSYFTYVTALPTVDLSSPLLQISIDTLCLAELGTLYDDERCLQESRSRYVRALPMLASELAKPRSVQLRKDHILAAISVLALCELFDALARGSEGGQGWISHVQGAQTYLRFHHKEVMNSPFGWLLFHNIRHMTLCMSTVQRKANYFADPYWLNFTRSDAKKDSFVALYDICTRVPGLLERADNLAASREFDEDFSDVCRDLLRLRQELTEWFQFHHVLKGGMKYETVDARDMTEFTKLCPNTTFMTVYSFPSMQICSQYQLFWTNCLMVDYTVANIYRSYRPTHGLPAIRTFTTRTGSEIWRDMYVAATHYCRCVPYCCEPETSSIGRVGTFLLRITSSFFDLGGFERELGWCQDVRRMLQGNSLAVAPTTSNSPPSSFHSASPVSSPSSSSSSSPSSSPLPLPPAGASYPAHPPGPPAPILLEGEYPSTGYTPRSHSASSHATTPTIARSLPTIQPCTPPSPTDHLRTEPSPPDPSSSTNGHFRLPDTSEIASRLGIRGSSGDGGAGAKAVGPGARREGGQHQHQHAFLHHLNGASVLADEHAARVPGVSLGVTRGYGEGEGERGEGRGSPQPVDLEGMKSAIRDREGVLSCSEEFMPPRYLERVLVGNTPVMGPDGMPRRGPVGAACF